jgi:hypothetical protein
MSSNRRCVILPDKTWQDGFVKYLKVKEGMSLTCLISYITDFEVPMEACF